MAKVIFHKDGETKETTLSDGQRVLSAGYTLGYDEDGFGECGGSCICSTCHVRVMKGDFPAAKAEEMDVLDTLPHVYPNSRLACQLTVSGQDEIEVEWVG